MNKPYRNWAALFDLFRILLEGNAAMAQETLKAMSERNISVHEAEGKPQSGGEPQVYGGGSEREKPVI